jgi:hypothetical protein
MDSFDIVQKLVDSLPFSKDSFCIQYNLDGRQHRKVIHPVVPNEDEEPDELCLWAIMTWFAKYDLRGREIINAAFCNKSFSIVDNSIVDNSEFPVKNDEIARMIWIEYLFHQKNMEMLLWRLGNNNSISDTLCLEEYSGYWTCVQWPDDRIKDWNKLLIQPRGSYVVDHINDSIELFEYIALSNQVMRSIIKKITTNSTSNINPWEVVARFVDVVQGAQYIEEETSFDGTIHKLSTYDNNSYEIRCLVSNIVTCMKKDGFVDIVDGLDGLTDLDSD